MASASSRNIKRQGASTRRVKRGRPSKFGRPSRVVALTLPDDVVRGLRKMHSDLGWAIVGMFEKTPTRPESAPELDAELVTIGDRKSLIVVNPEMFKDLPGIQVVPLHDDKAFLAMDLGRGMTDLELAVLDRLDHAADRDERKALSKLRSQLKHWRNDRGLRFHTRAIIVVEQRRQPKTRAS
ncbi:MAG TPA: hypothetical protein VGH34_20160 [Vicinamibacterales bacterium]